MIDHLSSKISSMEERLDSNEEAMKRNQEQMYQSLQRPTSDHLIDSNENARADAGTDGIDSERQQDVEDCEKEEEDSLSVLINIQDEFAPESGLLSVDAFVLVTRDDEDDVLLETMY
jgi:hypothetical protein